MYRACAKRDRGFTLIELMVVVSIIGILSSIAIPSLLRSRMAANEVAAIGMLRSVSEAQSIFLRTDWDKDGLKEYAWSPDQLWGYWDWVGTPQETLALVDEGVAKANVQGWGMGWTNQRQSSHGYFIVSAPWYGRSPTEWGPGTGIWAWGFRKNGQYFDGYIRHGISAHPESYGMTGMNIFIMSDKGVIYQKDGFNECHPDGSLYDWWYPYGYSWQYDSRMEDVGWVAVQ